MSLTTSSNGLSSSPFVVSGFLSSFLGADLDRGFAFNSSPPFSARLSTGCVSNAINRKAKVLSSGVWFMGQEKLTIRARAPGSCTDLWIVENVKQPFISGKRRHCSVAPWLCPQLWVAPRRPDTGQRQSFQGTVGVAPGN